MIDWIRIENEAPEQAKKLLYFFEGTGVWAGFYYGRDEDYPASNNHVFGSNVGFLTGDVTHWCYIDYPEEGEWRVEADKEFFKQDKKIIRDLKTPINYPPLSWTDPDISEE